MKLQSFINQVIQEICDGAKSAKTLPPCEVEMNLALTPEGDVCDLKSENAGRISFRMYVPWQNAGTEARLPERPASQPKKETKP